MFDSCSNDIDLLVIKNSYDVGKYFSLLFINYIYSAGVLSYGFALESARECGRMIIIGMAFGAIPDFVPFLGKSLETLVDKLLSMTNEWESRYERGLWKVLFSFCNCEMAR